MILPLIQIVVLAVIALYLRHWRKEQKRRSSQSWETLLGSLRPDWSARELSDHFLWKEDMTLNPEEAWQRMNGPHGLWVMHQNARIMLEMVDYATSHNTGQAPIDPMLIETLRSDAMQIRVCVLMALAKYGMSLANEGARINAYRAATLYTAMAARMTYLLQEHAAMIVPDFVAAM